ncbi:MAG: hypothetical protein U1E17_17195 [Geminicoccaceae bacterium]
MTGPLAPVSAAPGQAALDRPRDELDAGLECCAVCGCPGGPCTHAGSRPSARRRAVRCPFGRPAVAGAA